MSDTSKRSKRIERPARGYVNPRLITQGLIALESNTTKTKRTKKDLLDTGEKVFVDVQFKNIPSNSKTFIHNVILPNHWRLVLDSEIAIFVRHRKPENQAQKIQFMKDRDLDIENTHSYYQDLFEEKLEEPIRSRISRIITSKEFATEFNSFQKLDRLSKTYDLFLSDKQLMANKMNPLPRRLGRRFWVREKKIPIMVRLDAKNLNARFERALSTEPFYVVGRCSTERIQVGIMSQPKEEITENIMAFLNKLYDLYDDDVRTISLRSQYGTRIPFYADFSAECPKVTMRRLKNRTKPVIDEFDMLEGEVKVSVHPDGKVRVLRQKRRLSSSPEKPPKKTRRVH